MFAMAPLHAAHHAPPSPYLNKLFGIHHLPLFPSLLLAIVDWAKAISCNFDDALGCGWLTDSKVRLSLRVSMAACSERSTILPRSSDLSVVRSSREYSASVRWSASSCSFSHARVVE